MKIYFAAHATTTDNATGIASGWKDAELSELGIKQAEEMRESLKNLKFDLICCSDLRRAVNTVWLAFGDKYQVISDHRLRELNYGDFNGGDAKTVADMKINAIKNPMPNGESYEQAMVRAQSFYKELKDKFPEKVILVVGHRATQYGLDTLTGKKLEDLLSVPFVWQPFWEYEI